MILIITTAIIENNAKSESVVISETKILALKDNTSLKGNFFLGSGNINGTMQYVYLIETEENGIQLQTINANSIYIIQEEKINPRIVIYRKQPVNNILKWLWLPTIDNIQKKIYIPKGSIKYDFTVDLQ